MKTYIQYWYCKQCVHVIKTINSPAVGFMPKLFCIECAHEALGIIFAETGSHHRAIEIDFRLTVEKT